MPLTTMLRFTSSANFKAYDSILQTCVFGKIKPNTLARSEPRLLYHFPQYWCQKHHKRLSITQPQYIFFDPGKYNH